MPVPHYLDRLVRVCAFCNHPRFWHTSWGGCSHCPCRRTGKEAAEQGIRELDRPLIEFLREPEEGPSLAEQISSRGLA